jgi:hypothetical protein
MPSDDHSSPSRLPAISWREWVSLPDLGIPAIKVKVDTGARTSALHTHDYTIEETPEGTFANFHVHPRRRDPSVVIACRAPVTDFRVVSDSGGHRETRPFITSRLRVGEMEWDVELSLVNRESMRFRMLLGRKALAGRVAVDCGASFLHGHHLYKVYRNWPRAI